MNSVYTTLLVSPLSTIVASIAGTFAAIGLYAMSRRRRAAVNAVNNIPMMNAGYRHRRQPVPAVRGVLQRLGRLRRVDEFVAVAGGAAGAPDHGLRHAAAGPYLLHIPYVTILSVGP